MPPITCPAAPWEQTVAGAVPRSLAQPDVLRRTPSGSVGLSLALLLEVALE
jgi:hypothetical protein